MPSIGWRHREWLMLTGCGRCRRFVDHGVTHPLDEDDPPMNALCEGCFDLIMSLGEGETLPPLESN